MRKEHPGPGVAKKGDPLENLLRGLWTEAAKRGETSVAGRLFQLVHRLDSQITVDLMDLRRPESGNAQHLEQTVGSGCAQSLEVGRLAQLDEIADHTECGWSDPG